MAIASGGAAVLGVLVLATPVLFEQVAAFFEAKAAYLYKDIEERRRDLSAELAKLDRPCVVVIDDLDRLTDEEIRLVFQLVKANSNLPKLVYLLLFQRDKVTKALTSVSGERGDEFLKKLVQVSFDIPDVPETRLHKVLIEALNEIFSQPCLLKHWNQDRWDDLFNGYLKPYFRTLRDVYRYLGSLRFHVGMHVNNGVFEVNPIDLIAVEALRVFEHSAYERIKLSWLGKQNHFIQLLFGREDRQERVQVALEEVLKGESDPKKKERLEGLVKNLFPQTSPHYDGTDTGWDRDLRICHENHFSKYFEMAVRKDSVSELQMSQVLDVARDRDLFSQKLGQLKEGGFLDEVLCRLPQYLEDIPLTSAASFITGLCDVGDSLPREKPGAFTTDPVVLLARLVQQFVLRCNPKDRLNLLSGMMAQTPGLVVPVIVADAQVRRNRPDQGSHKFLVEEADVPKLTGICVGKIRKEAAEQRLMNSRHFLFFLIRWRLWGKPEDVESWLQQTITNAGAAIAFILSSLTYVSSSGARETQVIPVVHLKVLEQFVSAEKLESLTAELDVNG